MNRQTIIENMMMPSTVARPIELYVYLDPLCDQCWSLQPILRKLQIEYEQYFKLRIALRTSLSKLNLQCTRDDESSEEKHGKSHAVFPSIAIKAAEFQGKRAGFRFLSKTLEYTYLKSRNVSSYNVLLEIAEKLNLDVDEFVRDFSSKNVLRSLQVDLYLAKEMEVDTAPTFVFFNENIEDEGLKISGIYHYEVYEQILEELIGQTIMPGTPPSLDDLFKRFDTLTTSEIAEIYKTPEKVVERALKKKLLQQQVERITVQDLTLWRKKQ